MVFHVELFSWILIIFQQSVVLCHTWLACLRESNFERATEFIPERWLNDSSCKSSILVIPFGYGRRMCPGKRFVELELQVVLARVRLLIIFLSC